ncbi:alpha/beta hydrolase, partial [Deinococcus pimensis]|uniref:alpha/beta hydrolase n=1 Tax=Deinococcus pimensis TaxID=309888 RepID=UPI0005EB2775
MRDIRTDRLTTRVRERAAAGAQATRLLLVHGNVSSGAFFEPLMAALPADVHVAAPDLRGYGDTEARAIDATRGLRDFSDDLWALLVALGWTRDVHVLGWSLGGGVAAQLAIDHPDALASLTLVAPISPFGFGGTHGEDGRPNSADFAGSGGGTVNADFVRAVAAGERGDGPGSPRDVMRQFYFHEWRPDPETEERFLDSMLATRTGEDFYPGDLTPSASWPGVAPGTRGVANAFSP